MYDNTTIKEKQHQLSLIIKRFIEFCEENGLSYFAFGGTCLGAIRHNGFIPWDDDVDLAMPRKDYDKMLELRDKLPKELAVINGYNCEHYVCCMTRIHDVTTTYIQEEHMKYPDRYTGFCIDIMPIDGLPDDENERIKHLKKLKKLRRLNRAFRTGFKKAVLKPVNIFIPLARKMSGDYAVYLKRFDKEVTKYPFDCGKFVCHGAAALNENMNKKCIPIECFLEWIEVDFEDFKIRVPKEYDLYLKHYYGDDYMQLPPENERAEHSVGIADNKESYVHYQKQHK